MLGSGALERVQWQESWGFESQKDGFVLFVL